MKRIVSLVVLFAVTVSGNSPAQGDPDASGEVILKYHDNRCEAKLLIEYYQKGTDAHVNSELTNDSCGASSGDYTIHVRYKDAQGEIKLLEFEETWAREDDAKWISERDYFIEDDVDIIRVKARGLSCMCKKPEAKEAEPDSEPVSDEATP